MGNWCGARGSSKKALAQQESYPPLSLVAKGGTAAGPPPGEGPTMAPRKGEVYLGLDDEGTPIHGVMVNKGNKKLVMHVRKGNTVEEALDRPQVHPPHIHIPQKRQGFLDEIRENLMVTDSNESSHGAMGFLP